MGKEAMGKGGVSGAESKPDSPVVYIVSYHYFITKLDTYTF
jgi:hypothetical protein